MRLTTKTRPDKPRLFPLRWWLQLTSLLLLIGSILLWRSPGSKQHPLQTSTQTLAPGLTLRKFATQTPAGPTQIYLVRGEKAAGWRFNLAQSRGNILQRETVTQIATREKAPVAVNGGFFAYNGAALGAVKQNGEWVRLPWKNRTALGLKADGTARIANLRGMARITINGTPLQNEIAITLNGGAPLNGMAILTGRFGNPYPLRAGDTALEIEGGKITRLLTQGTAGIRKGGWTLIANGTSTTLPALAGAVPGQSAAWTIETTPADWNDYPTILGAGPRLVKDGLAAEASREEEFRPDVLLRGSRTGVGIDKDGNPLFLIADGQDTSSPGLTLPELAQLMASLGVRDALHMDCGPSSVLAINGKVANKPWQNQPSGLNEPTVPNAILLMNH